MFKSNPFFLEHPQALQIHIYLDEIQLCNPIGSYTHKIVLIYFLIGNLDPKYRSSFKSIYLLAMFYHEQVDLYDMNVFLDPIVEELKQLEAGQLFNIHGKLVKVFGTLTAVVADNLASHEVGGFKTGFATGNRKCRWCLAMDIDIQSKCRENEFIARTKDDHDEQCGELNLPELSNHYSWLYGINNISIFNTLLHFHVIGGLAPDIMHDVLEGALPLTLSKLILHCIEEKYFNLKQLNHLILNFNYGYSEIKDKPARITMKQLKDETIRGSATQKWLLAVNFLIMFGSKIKVDDQFLHCFCLLLEICRLIFKKSILKVEVLNMEILIAEYLTSFKICWPDRRIIPKMHHLIHYPRYIREYGPLGAVWCMRYEGKHSYFKSLQRRIGNWINLPWTLSFRHQQWMCQKLKSNHAINFLAFSVVVSKTKHLLSCMHLEFKGQLAVFLGVDNLLSVVSSYLWIEVGSIKFKLNDSVVVFKLPGNKFHFGVIVLIFSHKDSKKIGFTCRVLKVIEFDYRFQAYKVRERRDKFHAVISMSDLVDFRSFSLHKPGFVTLDDLSKKVNYIITKTEFEQYFPNVSFKCTC